MFEKYNAFEVGVGGGGGEYTPQLGFGWSNGVALVLLDMLNPEDSSKHNGSDDDTLGAGAVVGIIVASLVLLAVFGYAYFRLSHNIKASGGVDTTKLTDSNHGSHEA
jgi:H+/Cl- antiporter ClcA